MKEEKEINEVVEKSAISYFYVPSRQISPYYYRGKMLQQKELIRNMGVGKAAFIDYCIKEGMA